MEFVETVRVALMWALIYLGAGTLSWLIMRLFHRLDHPKKGKKQ